MNEINAIEIKNLTKNFGEKQAVAGLDMVVPKGAIYGFIGENGSGKSTTEKMICGLIHPSSGEIKLFGKDYTDADVRSKIGVLIEAPGCFPSMTVWNNLKIQASNLGIKNADDEIRRVLKRVRMEGAASNKYKNCSLGMKQRIGIAMALMGKPELMREVLTDLTKNHGCTVLISSHILGELEKIATHYGIIRGGKMVVQMTAEKLENDCPIFVALKAKNMEKAKAVLNKKYQRVETENETLRVYDADSAEEVVEFLYRSGIVVTEIETDKISLEEYYINLMNNEKGVK